MMSRSLSRPLMDSLIAFVLLASPIGAARAQDVETRAIGGIGLTVYANSNYGGRSATFRNDVPDLRSYDGLDDAISSLRAGPGEFWEVCEESRYRGRCIVVSESEANLSLVGWNDQISSLRLVRNGGGGKPPEIAEIVLYSSQSFRGESVYIDNAVRHLGQRGFDDRARSARITGRWELCRDGDYRGCTILDRDAPSLLELGLDRRITSLRPAPVAEIVLYSSQSFRGESVYIDNAVRHLGQRGFDDRARSARITGRWELCRDGDYRRCTALDRDVPSLLELGLDRRITSLRPAPIQGSPVAEIVLYSSRNYTGESVSFNGTVRSLRQHGFDDRARSARITGRWQLCRDEDYRNCATLDQNLASLDQLGLDQRVSSLRPMDTGGPDQGTWRLTLYKGRNYAGDSQTVTVGTSLLFTISGQSRSARVVGTWQVCTGIAYTGQCQILSDNVSDLDEWNLANRIISARPVRP